MRTPIIVALVASLCLAATALAEDYDWNTEVSTSGNWSDTTEWSSTTGSYPGAVAGDIARIQSEWPSATIVVDGDYALSELRIEKGNRSPHYASLTLDGTANTLTVSDAVALGNDASANRQNIKCMLSGTADLTMTGGLFRLNSTANTLTGQTYITGGELEVYSVGTGTINVSGGGSLNPCQTLANPIVFDGGQYELLFNGAPGTAFTGTVTLA